MSLKFINGLRDLGPFGFKTLTGEACGLSYRILTDLTYRGYKIYCECHGLKIEPKDQIVKRETDNSTDNSTDSPTNNFTIHTPPGFNDAFNFGLSADPHICSVMLAPDDWISLGIFALFDYGCQAVEILEQWRSDNSLNNERLRHHILNKGCEEYNLRQGDYDSLPFQFYEKLPMRSIEQLMLMGYDKTDALTDTYRLHRINKDKLRVFVRSSAPGTGLRNEHQFTGRIN